MGMTLSAFRDKGLGSRDWVTRYTATFYRTYTDDNTGQIYNSLNKQ